MSGRIDIGCGTALTYYSLARGPNADFEELSKRLLHQTILVSAVARYFKLLGMYPDTVVARRAELVLPETLLFN